VRFPRRGAWNGTYLDIFWACACDNVVGRQFELVVATREDIVEECFIGSGKPLIGDMLLLCVGSECVRVGK
jgi:hypothetical protein